MDKDVIKEILTRAEIKFVEDGDVIRTEDTKFFFYPDGRLRYVCS